MNLIYQNGMIPTVSKPTRVTKKTATAIDHIIISSFEENSETSENKPTLISIIFWIFSNIKGLIT